VLCPRAAPGALAERTDHGSGLGDRTGYDTQLGALLVWGMVQR
jgi:hypothetical protein